MKPYVPHFDNVGQNSQVRIPDWINEGAPKRRKVHFTKDASLQLEALVGKLKFYSSLDSAMEAITEILEVDVRSIHKTSVSRKYSCHLKFDNVKVQFKVLDDQDDIVEVESVVLSDTPYQDLSSSPM